MERLLHGPFDTAKNSMVNALSFILVISLNPVVTISRWHRYHRYSSLSSFFLAMVKYPEYQKKAQDELDRVEVGGDRLPDFSDKGNLPYIQVIVYEVLSYGKTLFVSISTKQPIFSGGSLSLR